MKTTSLLLFIIAWNTQNIQSLFPLKLKVEHFSCVIFRGDCPCHQNYVEETVCYSYIRWNEH